MQALHLAILHRHWDEACWQVLTWRAATAAAFAGDLLWGLRPEWRRSYLRRRDSIAAVLRFASFGLGLGSDAIWRQMDAIAAPPSAGSSATPMGLALHAGRFVFASGAVPLIMGLLALRTNLW